MKMDTQRLNDRIQWRMSLEEEEQTLSSNFWNLEIEEENSSEVPFTILTKNSKFFGRSNTFRLNEAEANSPHKPRGKTII